jgi:hypothetical protein
MSLTSTGTRILAAALIALALFFIAFLVARGSSSEAAPAQVREQPASAAGTLAHAPLRAIGAVPALPRAPRTRTRTPPRASTAPPASTPPAPPPPPVFVPPPPTRPPPPPPPPQGCVGEFC